MGLFTGLGVLAASDYLHHKKRRRPPPTTKQAVIAWLTVTAILVPTFTLAGQFILAVVVILTAIGVSLYVAHRNGDIGGGQGIRASDGRHTPRRTRSRR